MSLDAPTRACLLCSLPPPPDIHVVVFQPAARAVLLRLVSQDDGPRTVRRAWCFVVLASTISCFCTFVAVRPRSWLQATTTARQIETHRPRSCGSLRRSNVRTRKCTPPSTRVTYVRTLWYSGVRTNKRLTEKTQLRTTAPLI